MTPDEVIEKLKDIGIEISRPTLSRYEKQKLIPSPERGSLGRAGGRWTDYPENTVEEVCVAWKLMHGDYGDDSIRKIFGGKMPALNPTTVAEIRDMYYLLKVCEVDIGKAREKMKQHGYYDEKLWGELCAESTAITLVQEKRDDSNWKFLMGFEVLWEMEFKKAKEKVLGN